MNNTINYSSDVARLLSKGYGSISEPIYVDSNGQIQIATNVQANGGDFLPLTGGTLTGSLKINYYDLQLGTSGTDSNDSGDIVWLYGDGTEKMRIWTANTYTSISGPNYRVYQADGTSLYSGTLGIYNRDTCLLDRTNSTATYLNYGAAGLAASAITWLCCWNGYEIRAISKAEMANAVDSSHKWVRLAGDTMTGLLKITTNSNTVTIGSQNTGWCHFTNSAAISFYFNHAVHAVDGFTVYNTTAHLTSGECAVTSGGRVHANGGNLYIGNSSNAGWVLTQDICSHSGAGDTYWSLRVAGTAHFKTAYGAVWNDYAEMRNVPIAQKDIISISDDKGEKERNYPYAGHCVYEIGNGQMKLTYERCQKGCKIISDTFGFCIGETEDCKTPIAVTGRVLAYPFEDKELYWQHIGDCVCSGPNGTISIMSPDEVRDHPECIVGTISEVPTYDTWYCGNSTTPPPFCERTNLGICPIILRYNGGATINE